MPLGIHQNFIDFEILETGNVKTFVFLDSSQYMGKPERPLLEITLPGQTKYFLVNILPMQVNTFNSNTLGLGAITGDGCLADLPDGIYQMKFKVCPYEFSFKIKYYLRATALVNKLKIIYTQKDLKPRPPHEERVIKDNIVDIMLGIESGKAFAEQGNSTEANRLYQIANRLADKTLRMLEFNCNNAHCNV